MSTERTKVVVTGVGATTPVGGDATSTWEALLAGPLDVVVQFHEPVSLDMMDRKELAKIAWDTVRRGQAAALAGIF